MNLKQTNDAGKKAFYGKVMASVLIALFWAGGGPLYDEAAAQTDRPDAAQRYSFDFSGELLADVLETLATSTQANLMYDPELVSREYVYLRLRGNSIQELLRVLLAGSTLDFITLSSGTIVIVQARERSRAYG
ncbi:MAG: STN domain-containing protein, partial [Cyclonatronaceae bacterium]